MFKILTYIPKVARVVIRATKSGLRYAKNGINAAAGVVSRGAGTVVSAGAKGVDKLKVLALPVITRIKGLPTWVTSSAVVVAGGLGLDFLINYVLAYAFKDEVNQEALNDKMYDFATELIRLRPANMQEVMTTAEVVGFWSVVPQEILDLVVTEEEEEEPEDPRKQRAVSFFLHRSLGDDLSREMRTAVANLNELYGSQSTTSDNYNLSLRGRHQRAAMLRNYLIAIAKIQAMITLAYDDLAMMTGLDIGPLGRSLSNLLTKVAIVDREILTDHVIEDSLRRLAADPKSCDAIEEKYVECLSLIDTTTSLSSSRYMALF